MSEMLQNVLNSLDLSLEFIFNVIVDMISNVSLTIGCILTISYLREVPPEINRNFKTVRILSLPALAAIIQRFFAHCVARKSENGKTFPLPSFEDAMSNYLNKEIDAEFKDYFSIFLTLIISFGTALLICYCAMSIMNVKNVKHVLPMLVFQGIGLGLRYLFKNLYSALLSSAAGKILAKDNFNTGTEPFGYNGFAYGVFMLLAIIAYIYFSKKRDKNFWVSKAKLFRYVLSLIAFIILFSISNIAIFCEKANLNFITSNQTGLNSHGENAISFIYVFLFAFIFALLVFFLLYIPQSSYKLMQIQLTEANKEEELEKRTKAYSRYNEEMAKFEHDLPKNLKLAEAMALKENAKDTADFTHSLLEDFYNARRGFVSGNQVLDNMLYDKKEAAEKFNTDITFEGYFPENGIEAIDINKVLGNAIDNAKEACKELDAPRYIRISAKPKNDYVYIKVVNPSKEVKFDESGIPVSSKPDKVNHGYGCRIITETVKKYSGTCEFIYENGTFTFQAKMKCK